MQFSSLLVLLLLGVSACLVNCLGGGGGDTTGNDYTYGAKAAADLLIAREVVTQSKAILFQTTTKTYTLTQAGATPKTIHYIHITDLRRKRGATAEIQSGGVGDTTVTIKFTSARGGSVKSQVEIWGA